MAKLTDQDLSTKAGDKNLWLYDDAISKGHGELCVRITTGGSKRFYFRYVGPNSERVRLSLGVYSPTGGGGSTDAARLTLKAARTEAAKLSLLHQSGVTDIKGHLEAERRLAEARRTAEEARLEVERKAAEVEASRMTVEELFERWEALHLANHKDGGAEIRRLFEKDVFPVIGTLPAHLVRKGDVMQCVDALIQRKANRTAKRLFASIRQMFRFALARDYVEIDPTAAIGKAATFGKDNERERVLSDDEIKLLAKQMPSANLIPTTEAAVWIALATGCRIGELLKARWEHVDLKARRWLIPAENSKNGAPLEVYLSDFALPYFETLKQHRETDWLYSARWRDKETGKVPDSHVCVKTITKQVGDRQKTIIKKKGTKAKGTLSLPGGLWTMHDLRRTASTIMGDLGIRPEVIDRCQNHKEQNRIRRTYQRYSYRAEMEEAWKLLGSRLGALASGQEPAKVIPMEGRKRVTA